MFPDRIILGKLFSFFFALIFILKISYNFCGTEFWWRFQFIKNLSDGAFAAFRFWVLLLWESWVDPEWKAWILWSSHLRIESFETCIMHGLILDFNYHLFDILKEYWDCLLEANRGQRVTGAEAIAMWILSICIRIYGVIDWGIKKILTFQI